MAEGLGGCVSGIYPAGKRKIIIIHFPGKQGEQDNAYTHNQRGSKQMVGENVINYVVAGKGQGGINRIAGNPGETDRVDRELPK